MARSGPDGASVVLAIMAKVPRAGEVKTRLCPPLTAAEAAEIYRCFLLDKIEQVRGLPGVTPAIAYAPPEERRVFEDLAPGWVLVAQRGPDLGSRLDHAFEDLLALGHQGVVMIDSDTPSLPREYLAEAVARLTSPGVDLILGPSEDGGYYLIGLRAPQPELFSRMAWSTPDVLPETLRRARALGLRPALLPPWFDVDTGEDLERLRVSLRAAAGPTPRHTRRFLLDGAR
ncbi:MAG TPA: TIGR04282 family arsenosugar biosynthesis glycosyltransferase [Methylomirabilota bacterium]|nr:TIGR04282 family arsenosugar biosynthesis glycosyltransferase [Methylomirabilota bacterium]